MAVAISKISFLQACMVLLLMNGLANHVIVNPMILDASGRDAWISVLCTGVIGIFWILILVFIMKKSGQQKLQPWLASQIGSFFSWVLLIPVCIQLFLIGGLTIVQTVNWTTTNYMPASPPPALAVVLALVCGLCAFWGIRVLAIMSGLLLPIVIFLGYFVSLSNMNQKDFSLLKPYVEHGWNPVFHGIVYAGGGFIELITLILMQHRLKSKVRTRYVLIFFVISVYIMLGPVIGAITEFGPIEAAKQMQSPYEQWRLVKIGTYIEHVDFFSIYQWLAGACIRISMSIFLLKEILPLKRTWAKNTLICSITACYIILATLPINEYSFYLWTYHVYFPITLTVICSTSILWAVISLFAKPSKVGVV